MKYLRRGGGYYFNVGASDLIVDGKIKLLQHQDIDRVVANGLLMKDGSVAEADVIVAATGYKNQQDVVRHFMGDTIADRIGQVWGFDETVSSAICGAVHRNPVFGLPAGDCRTSVSSRSISHNR